MATLLSDLEQAKKPFQVYTLEHGIERLTLLLPLKEAASFEQEFEKSDRSKETILELVVRHSGRVTNGAA